MSLPPVCLGPGDPPPVTVYNRRGAAHALIVCDHASAAMPAALGTLGLPVERLAEHIAFDLGAAPLARALADRLDVPLVLGGYSRLVIDLNRFPDHPSSVPAVSDHVVVPGNQGLSETAREARRREIFWPYHRRVRAALDRLTAAAPDPVVVAVHSFTPSMDGFKRPWHVGVLSNRDRRIADPLLEVLGARGDLSVGDNRPYSALEPLGFTCVTHCEGRDLPHVLVEVRQDLLGDHAGIVAWADILAPALRAAAGL